MSLMSRDPGAAAVAMDRATGRPTQIRLGLDAWPVTSIDAVRDETAAYPVGTGPRTVFQVTSKGRRFRLVHLHQERRWTVEPLESAVESFDRAA